MENVIRKLEASPEAKSVVGLAEAIKSVKEAIANREKTQIYEVRRRLLDIFTQIFAAKKPKLSLVAMDGLQMILRDSSFYSDNNECRLADSLSTQLLACLEPAATWSPLILPQVFTIIVQLISGNEFCISMTHVFTAIQLCFKVYLSSDDPAVKLAVRAALTQLLNSYCLNRQLKATETNSQEEVAMLMDVTTLLNEILPRLDCSASEKNTASELQLALDALYSIISAQPPYFYRHAPLLSLFRSEIIPALVCLLQVCEDGSMLPSSTSRLTITKRLNTLRNGTSLNGSGVPAGRPNIFVTPEIARSFYQVVEQILLLFSGREEDSKLILELYRSALLAIPTTKRSEALKLIKRMVLTPQRLFVYLTNLRDEPLYWLMPMECVEECAKSTSTEIAVEALHCLGALFTAFSGFVSNVNLAGFSNNFLQKIDEEFVERKSLAQRIQLERRNSKTNSCSQAALTFIDAIRRQISTWMALDDISQIDESLQRFAIDISKEFSTIYDPTNFNTTTIYLTTYAVLDLYFRGLNDQEIEDFETWIQKVTTSGTSLINVCSDKKWLAEVYEAILQEDVVSDKHRSLQILVNDYNGSGNNVFAIVDDQSDEGPDDCSKAKLRRKFLVEKWIQSIVASCWSSILVVLSRFSLRDQRKTQLISNTSITLASIGGVIAPGASAQPMNEKAMIDGAKATLECMHSLLSLLIRFNMHKEMSWIYERLGEEICQLEELRQLTASSTITGNQTVTIKRPWLLLNRNDAFAISMMLENAIRFPAFTNSVWKYVIRAVEYTSELERYLFQTRKEQVYDPTTCASGNESSESVLELSANELTASEVSKVLDELLLKIDKFFENAPKKLSMSSICTLITTLISTNEDNLKYSGDTCSTAFSRITSCVLLQRVSQLVCGVNERNFIHSLKAWHCAKEHFTETAFSKFPDDVTKMSICCIYDCIKSLLIDERIGERSHFGFNSSLFSVFQTILCSDVAKAEIQEHIISVLSAFVEENNEKIGTGWKPLFSVIKTIQVSGSGTGAVVCLPRANESVDAVENHTADFKLSPVNITMLDLFKKFLEIRNRQVVYAALPDYINCLVGSLRSVSVAALQNDQSENSPEISFMEQHITLAVVSFLRDVQTFLLDLYNEASVAHINDTLHENWMNRESIDYLVHFEACLQRLKLVPDLSSQLNNSLVFENTLPAKCLQASQLKWTVELPLKNSTDAQKCVCELFCALADDLCGLLTNASQHIHSQLVGALSELVECIKSSFIGAEFGASLLSLQIFPTLQAWAAECPPNFTSTSLITVKLRNIKQSAGIFTQLVVDFIDEFSGELWCETLLKSALCTFICFIGHSSQFVSGVGCACLKHLLFSAADALTSNMWNSVATAMWEAISLTLFPLRALLGQFFPNSNECCGDMGEMTVTVDDSHNHASKTARSEFIAMAKQPNQELHGILTDEQVSSNECTEVKLARQFSYTFVFNEASGHEQFSVSLEEVVSGLFNHQTLMQIVCQLLTGHANILLTVGCLITESFSDTATKFSCTSGPECQVLAVLLCCAEVSTTVAQQFEVRPPLKFLIQKLTGLEEISSREVSVNLYKIYVTSKTAELWALFKLASAQLTLNGVNVSESRKTVQRRLDECLDELENAENVAAKHKLAAFARERFYEPIEFTLADCESVTSANHTTFRKLRVVKKDDYLKAYNRNKMAETTPKPVGNTGKNFDASAFEDPSTTERGTIVNPFTQSADSRRDTGEVGNGNVDSEEPMRSFNFDYLDVRVLAHSEVVAAFFYSLSQHADAETFCDAQSWVFERVRRYLLLTGNSRARSAIAAFLHRVDVERISKSQKAS